MQAEDILQEEEMEFTRKVVITPGQELNPCTEQGQYIFKKGPYTAVRDTGRIGLDYFPIWKITDRDGTEEEASLAWFFNPLMFPLEVTSD